MRIKSLSAMLAVFSIGALCTPDAFAQGLKSFNLSNGMSVYIWEDASMTDVYGEVAVRVGSVNDPEEYTGLAHYLEHVMFKGTTAIGALDWEKERPVYEKIIDGYDRMAQVSDPEEKNAIAKEINTLSIEQAGYSVLNEYSNLIEGIGGSDLNAGTSYDCTYYHNRFPANEIFRWLRVASDRFVNPVFRAFQSELETVYEEYNMYQDNRSSKSQQMMMQTIFAGTPYARDIIGLGEHLKNPRLSKLIEFYDAWYTPENMALILIGNISAKSLIVPIKATFGKLPARPSPERKVYPDNAISGQKNVTFRMSDSPYVVMAFNGPVEGADDEIATELCLQILSNNYGTGILDRMTRAGDFMGAAASSASLGNQGRILIQAVPYYDQSQRTYESSKKVVKMLNEAISKLSSGDFDDDILTALKLCMCRDYDLQMESDQIKASIIRDAFTYGTDIGKALNYKDILTSTTAEDVKAAASRYFTDDVTVIFNEKGRPDKGEKMEKPEIKPLSPQKGQSSLYAQQFRAIKTSGIPEIFSDWSRVSEKQVNTWSRLYCTRAEKNEVFTLTLKYGANSQMFPMLRYGASLMNSAGIMALCNSEKLKEDFSDMGATYRVSADDEYLYVTLYGYEKYLKETCTLLTRLILMPELDDKRLGNVIGMAANERMIRKDNVDYLRSALSEYMRYGENSTYRKEPTDMEILGMDMSKLTGSVLNATKYAADIYYSGQLSIDEVYPILISSLPLVEGEHESISPVIREMKNYSENTVFFLPNTDVQQTQILFYIPMGEHDPSDRVVRDAFSRYIGGGFNGLIMQEIREFNSMAYTASGGVSSRELPGSGQGFTGYVGTQNDKAVDAIRLYLSLLSDMPQHPENLESIKSYLLQSRLTGKPDDRELAAAVTSWRQKGYTHDPAVEEVPRIKELTWEDIMSWYESEIKGRPIAIGVIGSPKDLTQKALSEFGKVIRISGNDLFNSTDTVF